MRPVSRAWLPWAYLLPVLLVLACLVAFPFFNVIRYSLTDFDFADPSRRRWVGLMNYGLILTDPQWWQSVWLTVRFTVTSVALETLLGLGFALLLNSRRLGGASGLMRATAIVPWAIPAVVGARLWQWMLHDQNGVINELLVGIGLISTKIAWIAHPDTVFWAVVAADVWQATPFMTLLILAGLAQLPGDLIEAAHIDGAGPVQRFRFVVLPILRPTLIVAILFRGLDALRIFDLVYVLGGNGPGTSTMSIVARRELVEFQALGYGSALSMVMFGIIAVIAIVWVTAMRLDTMRGEGP